MGFPGLTLTTAESLLGDISLFGGGRPVLFSPPKEKLLPVRGGEGVSGVTEESGLQS